LLTLLKGGSQWYHANRMCESEGIFNGVSAFSHSGLEAALVHPGVEWQDLPMLLVTGQLLMGFECQKMSPWDTVETEVTAVTACKLVPCTFQEKRQ